MRIARGEIEQDQWEDAKNELIEEVGLSTKFTYEPATKCRLDTAFGHYSKILKAVFNSEVPGQIEILFRPSNRKEAFKNEKTSDEAFALIRIGDISPGSKRSSPVMRSTIALAMRVSLRDWINHLPASIYRIPQFLRGLGF